MMRCFLLLLICIFNGDSLVGQLIEGRVLNENGQGLSYANAFIIQTREGVACDETGYFAISTEYQGTCEIRISHVGYKTIGKRIELVKGKNIFLEFQLEPDKELEALVVTGTMSEVSRAESPVAVEVYSQEFFDRNPTSSVFSCLQSINGIRPQLNCNVCNTGDIHINGLEGPYTLILIDGMPIVSGLSTVYGLMGIPNSMVERIEIVKGPASALYGSEAIGGLVNIITRDVEDHPAISLDRRISSWLEYDLNMAFRKSIENKADVLTGLNFYWYDQPFDYNNDNFTDITLSKRLSVFQKWSFHRKQDRVFTLASRMYIEDRWGGEMKWNDSFRGTDSVYGESISTNRLELISSYRLPTRMNLVLSSSYSFHRQNSFYGVLPFMANQYILFNQLIWTESFLNHKLASGLSLRNVHYDDNTIGTEENGINKPDNLYVPGIFVQDEIIFSDRTSMLTGLRLDKNKYHGHILTPRIAFKYGFSELKVFRINAGTGYRVVNIYTEDHASLTGARKVVIEEDLKPEKSYNVNLNYVFGIVNRRGQFYNADISVWYSYFTNKITPDYDTDINSIYYRNINGYSISKGLTLNFDMIVKNFKLKAGFTLQELHIVDKNNDEDLKIRPYLTESYSSKLLASYSWMKMRMNFDYSIALYGPMLLPTLGPLDPRPGTSPTWTLHDINVTKDLGKALQLYVGIKNIFNFLPPANSIARSNDPFDKDVLYDQNGNIIPTADNPYALSFDPSYVYAPNQGIRFFIGFKFTF